MDIGKTCIRSAIAVALLGASLAVQAHTVLIGWDDLGNGGDVTFYAGTYHIGGGPIGGLNILSGPAGVGGPYLFTSKIPDSPAISSILDGFDVWPGASGSLPPSLGGSGSIDWQLVTVSGLVSGSYSFSTTSTSAVEFPWSTNYVPSGMIAVTGNQIPTPGTLALLSFALAGLGFSRRRKLHGVATALRNPARVRLLRFFRTASSASV